MTPATPVMSHDDDEDDDDGDDDEDDDDNDSDDDDDLTRLELQSCFSSQDEK